LLPHIDEVVANANTVLRETINTLLEVERVLAVLREDRSVVNPAAIEVTEGKYRGRTLRLEKLQVSSGKVVLWGWSEETQKPVQVKGILTGHTGVPTQKEGKSK